MPQNPGERPTALRRGMTAYAWRVTEPATPIAAEAPPAQRKSLIASPLVRVSVYVTAFLLIGGAFLAVTFHAYQAVGASMEPHIHNGDRLVVGQLAYQEVDFGLLDWLPAYESSDLRWGSPERGDVVVFHSPVREEQLVKRIIGLPGDVIRIRDGAVYVNGVAITESYVQGETECFKTCGNIIVPEGHYFLLGDNRGNSVDSRQGWTVPLDAISGKVLFSF